MSRNRARPQREAADFTGIKANQKKKKEENKTLHTNTQRYKRGYGCISASVRKKGVKQSFKHPARHENVTSFNATCLLTVMVSFKHKDSLCLKVFWFFL